MKLVKRDGELFSKIILPLFLVTALAFPPFSHAARPFVTDDSGTLGEKGFQIESGTESSRKINRDGSIKVKETETELCTVFSYGIKGNFDVILGTQHSWKRVKEDGITLFRRNGFSDMTLDAKWRIYEKEGLSVALKPGITLPTGDYKRTFGTGRITYGLVLIISTESAPFGFHLNAGYRRNENKVDERKDLFSASFAVTHEVLNGLTVGGDIGFSSNTDPKTKTAPAFFLFGGSYRIGRYLSVDGGVKFGLNRQEPGRSFTGGIAIRF